MSESGDYEPAPQWSGHDFKSARGSYDNSAGRSYADAKAAGNTATMLLPERIAADSDQSVSIDTDFSGSMDGWDATIFSKLPYLDHEARTEYFGEDVAFSFGAIADTSDDYPLQIRDFAKGAEMKKRLPELVHAGGGQGSAMYHEAHGLAALYRLHNADVSNAATMPIYILITDEMPSSVSKNQAKGFAKVDISQGMSPEEIFAQLQLSYSVYVILKPYGSERLSGDTLAGVTKTVYDCWEKLLGADRIALLADPNRVVDVLFGIFAKETGKIDYFRKELEKRQLPDPDGKQKVATVYKSLATIHRLSGPRSASKSGTTVGHSKTRGIGAGTPTKPLM